MPPKKKKSHKSVPTPSWIIPGSLGRCDCLCVTVLTEGGSWLTVSGMSSLRVHFQGWAHRAPFCDTSWAVRQTQALCLLLPNLPPLSTSSLWPCVIVGFLMITLPRRGEGLTRGPQLWPTECHTIVAGLQQEPARQECSQPEGGQGTQPHVLRHRQEL